MLGISNKGGESMLLGRRRRIGRGRCRRRLKGKMGGLLNCFIGI